MENTNEYKKCLKLSIDCYKNDDIENLKNGGPEYVGYDFFIKPEHKNFILILTKNILDLLAIPYKKIYIDGTTKAKANEISTIEDIYDKLKKEQSKFNINKIKRKEKKLKF